MTRLFARPAVALLLTVALVACGQATPIASTAPGRANATTSPAATGAPSDDPLAELASKEIVLREENRTRAGLVNLGPGAAELATLVDRKESDLLWAGQSWVQAEIDGASSLNPTVILADLPAPGSTIIGPWAIVTVAFEHLLGDGPSNTRSLDDRALPNGDAPGSKTTTTHGCDSSPDGCMETQKENVTVAGNPGVISTDMTLTIGFDGSKVSMDVKVEISGEIHDAKTGAMIFRIESTGTGHADGDACPDASGTTKLHFEFTAKENYFNAAIAAGGSVGYGLNQTYTGDVTVKVDDQARMTGMDIAAKAHEDSKGGVKAPGEPQSDLFAHSVDSSGTQTFGYDSASGFTRTGGEDEAPTSMEALNLSVWMDLYTSLPAKAGAKAAEKAWRSGMCIVVQPTPDGGTVDKNSVTNVDVTVKQRYEGTELDKPVEAQFSGVASLDPVGQKQPAPAQFVYTAGPKEGDRGNITLESVSNRGIGHSGATFVVGKPQVETLTGDLLFKRVLLMDADQRGDTTLTETLTVHVRLRQTASLSSSMTFADDGSTLTYAADFTGPGTDPLCSEEDHAKASGTLAANGGAMTAQYADGTNGTGNGVELYMTLGYSGTHLILGGCEPDNANVPYVRTGVDAFSSTTFGCDTDNPLGVPAASGSVNRTFDFGCSINPYTSYTGDVSSVVNSGTLVLDP